MSATAPLRLTAGSSWRWLIVVHVPTNLVAMTSEDLPMEPIEEREGPQEVESIIVQQGRLLDFIDRVTQRLETPEEYVRQEIAKSLVREYGYPRSSIRIEFSLRLGSRKPRADIVIFRDGAPPNQENAVLIVECKSGKVRADDRKEGVGQLQSYMAACPNAQFGLWTNGTERFCFRRVEAKGIVSFDDVTDIPNFGQSEDDAERPKFTALKPASSDALLFAFRRCHNYIAGNQGLQKPEAFWELLKLIFCKIHDERASSTVEFYATSAERKSMNGELKVKSRVDRLFEAVKRDFPQIFKPSEEVELAPSVLAYIVSQLQTYSLLDSDVDVKGKAYEEVVGSNLRGDRGEFFTPRSICRMAVSMLDPSDSDLILDPACGTGGFLITAMNHVVEKIDIHERAKWGEGERSQTAARQRVQTFLARNLIGLDLNPNLVKAAKMNMVMNNDGAGGLFQANSLAAPATWTDQLRDLNLMGSVDVIVTNPPFGSKIPIDSPAILEAYDLGHAWGYDSIADSWVKSDLLQKSQPPEILFIERCVKLLKPGTGRAAIVLPDGILGSPGLGYVRQWILDQTRVLASIDLHADTFQPGTSVQTSVLVLRRKTDVEIELGRAGAFDYDIFMALADRIGHDKRGNTIYVRDAEGNEIVAPIKKKVREFQDGKLVTRVYSTLEKVVDDNTSDIARSFQSWLSADY